MDPQLRMLLLHSWKAIEDAGYISKEIPETSVYMSASTNSYRSLLPEETTAQLETPDGYVSWVLAQSGTIPTMISHKLGLKGPSYFVHANCSSSLIGLHSAFQSLQSGEAKYALVGGATLHTESSAGYVHQPGLNFSSDGHIKAFDAAADGMIGGEGAGAVLLKKRLMPLRTATIFMRCCAESASITTERIRSDFMRRASKDKLRSFRRSLIRRASIPKRSRTSKLTAQEQNSAIRLNCPHFNRCTADIQIKTILRHRFSQNKSRAFGYSGRNGGLHQGCHELISSGNRAEHQLQRAEPESSFRRLSVLRSGRKERVNP